ncbi:MAG: GNAT family N-acetyltransferase [Calothrix sp. MO_192.B10]|nr:GNAT family N-acetyltransferase [Calothrix sp. MO_192.B10]
MVIIREIEYLSIEYSRECHLRDIYLRKPLGLSLSEHDTKGEELQIHLGAFIEDKLIGCILIEPVGDGIYKLRQMLVIPEFQGCGMGTKLLKFAEDRCWHLGAERIFLHAREYASGFYAKYGYKIVSHPFEELGIPHYVMEKRIYSTTC